MSNIHHTLYGWLQAFFTRVAPLLVWLTYLGPVLDGIYSKPADGGGHR